MRAALGDLSLHSLSVIHAGADSFSMTDGVRAIGFPRIVEEVPRLASR
jgi:hypothetical protein